MVLRRRGASIGQESSAMDIPASSQPGTGTATVRQGAVERMHQMLGGDLEHPLCSGLGLARRGKRWDGDGGLSEALTRSPAAMKLGSRQAGSIC
jgi:hypothetical protein